MLNKLNKNRKILIIYLFISILIISFLHQIARMRDAREFDNYYTMTLILLIALYGIVFTKENLKSLVKQLTLIGILLSINTTIVFYILDLKDPYFSFELSGFTWLGLVGYTFTFVYILIGILLGVLLWAVKTILVVSGQYFWKRNRPK